MHLKFVLIFSVNNLPDPADDTGWYHSGDQGLLWSSGWSDKDMQE